MDVLHCRKVPELSPTELLFSLHKIRSQHVVPAPVKIVYRFLLFFGEELRTPFGATGEAGLTAT